MIQLLHTHMTAIALGAVFANGALMMNAIRDRSPGWAIFHIGLAMMCAAWFGWGIAMNQLRPLLQRHLMRRSRSPQAALGPAFQPHEPRCHQRGAESRTVRSAPGGILNHGPPPAAPSSLRAPTLRRRMKPGRRTPSTQTEGKTA